MSDEELIDIRVTDTAMASLWATGDPAEPFRGHVLLTPDKDGRCSIELWATDDPDLT